MPACLAWARPGSFADQSDLLSSSIDIRRYGSARDGFTVSNYTLNGMLWVAEFEFATPERESKLGTLMWPEW